MIEYKMRRDADRTDMTIEEGIETAVKTVEAERHGGVR